MNQTPFYNFSAATTDNATRFQLIFSLSPLSIPNKAIQSTSIYANNKTIYIKSNEILKQICICNILGQIVKTFECNDINIEINMNNYPDTYYFIKVITDRNVYSEKIMIK